MKFKWTAIIGAPGGNRTPTKNKEKINTNQRFINTWSTFNKCKNNISSPSTKFKFFTPQKLIKAHH